MKLANKWLAIALIPAFAATFTACGTDSDGTGDNGSNNANNKGGKSDEENNDFEPLNLLCDIANDTQTSPEFEGFADPIARFVLSGDDGECPSTYAELVERLAANDPDCAQEEGDPENGLESYVISETAQLADTPAGQSFRVVVSHQCRGESFQDRRPRHHVFFSLFGVGATTDEPGPNADDWRIPSTGIEVMSFDEVAGVYNYYEMGGGEWTYFGNSNDLLQGTAGRCQQCHTGGGAIMKELDTPWVHWEGHLDVPGARDLVTAHEDVLGKKASGSTLESLVKASNREWNAFRLEFRKQDGTKELLEPLFCATEINVDNGTDFKDNDFRQIKRDFFFDPHLKGAGSVNISEETYAAAIEQAGQFVQGVPGATDTVFKFVYPERAQGDNDYVDKLEEAGIIDENLMLDVLMVDFTNPLFSEDRCGLLQFVPELGPDVAAETLREGLIGELENASPADGTPEAELLANLQNAEDSTAHQERVEAFMAACTARDEAEMMADALEVVGDWRNQAREEHVFEFPASMPQFQNLSPRPGVKFNQETCVAEAE